MPASEAQLRALAKYKHANTIRVGLELNRKTDPDIIAQLQAVPSKQAYIKELIRKDIDEKAFAQNMNQPS